jgi:hypothetical protein
MIKRADFLNAMGQTLANIPELVALLAPDAPIGVYPEIATRNSVEKFIYQMQPGQLLVIWTESLLTRANMLKWDHRVEICFRALPGNSEFDIGDAIMAGVPVPGDGQIWRLCPIMPGVLPTEVGALTRRMDSEGVDYHVIATETAETGDWPYP